MKPPILSLVVMAALFAPAFPIQAQPYDIPIKPLYQNDYPDKLDNSKYSIADYGCTLTAWTMAINRALETAGLYVKNADGSAGGIISYDPAQMNKLLNDYRYEQKTYKKGPDGKYVREGGKLVVDSTKTVNGWGVEIAPDGTPTGSSTDINMGALLKAVEKDTQEKSHEGTGLKQERYRAPGWGGVPNIGPQGVTLDENYLFILDELAAGRPVVVRVAKDTHSVLVKSFHQEAGKPRGVGRYDIQDPFRNTDGTSIQWLDDPEYKNLIYGWDTGVFKAGGLHQPFEVPNQAFVDPLLLHDLEANPELFGPQVFRENHTIPEPSTLLLIGSGWMAAAAMQRKWRR